MSSCDTTLDANGMGSTVADFDNDGLLDWYVTSIYTADLHPDISGTGNMLYTPESREIVL